MLEQTFADCLRLMHQHAVRHLPVLDGGKVVAVVSIRDLLREAVDAQRQDHRRGRTRTNDDVHVDGLSFAAIGAQPSAQRSRGRCR